MSVFPELVAHWGHGADRAEYALEGGLSKRELFAAMVLQGMWAGRLAAEGDFPAYAMNAVFQADDLLAALEAK